MTHSLTPSQENYLEHIHRLSERGEVRVGDIAEAAGVRLPSVTRAVAKLSEAGLVRHQAYGSVEITERGVRAAEAVVRRDSCLRALLVEVLQMDDADARTEVCRLEHVLSAEVLARLEVLVHHAREPGSSSWLRSLALKIRRLRAPRRRGSAPQVGGTNLHAGP